MKVLVLLFLAIPVISLGQELRVGFEENDLTGWISCEQGHWCISGEDPIEGYYSLKHCFNNEEAGTDWISCIHEPLQLEGSGAAWQFKVRYLYAPSGNNNWAVFISDNCLPDQAGSIQKALILGVNYTGNSDEIKVWQASEGITNEIFNTGYNWQEHVLPGQEAEIILAREAGGDYTISIDTSGSGQKYLGRFVNDRLLSAGIFTLYYRYTATHDQGLFFDDLLIGGSFSPDTSAPEVRSLSVLSPTCLEVEFDEPILPVDTDETCVEGIGCGRISRAPSVSSKVMLPYGMTPGNRYTLRLPAVKDLYGNLHPGQSRQLDFYYHTAYDIIINEIMADPEPTVLLPAAEYLELFNASGHDISLKGWKMTINSRMFELPVMHLRAGEFALLSGAEYPEIFAGGLIIVKIDRFPALNNTGALITLHDATGRLIHSVSYLDDWHESTEKREGGWSLEMINPHNPCGESNNWQSSGDYRGGTPGKKNAVADLYQPEKAPELWRAAVTERNSLMLYFSEPLDSLAVVSPSYYRVDRGIGSPQKVIPAWPLSNSLELLFDKEFLFNIQYEVNLTSDLCDCAGTRLQYPGSMSFRRTGDPDSADILINEIHYAPEQGRREFIELVNHSGHTIDLKDYRLVTGDRDDSAGVITREYWPLAANDYAIIADGYSGIDAAEIFSKDEKIILMPDMPVLPDRGREIYLYSGMNKISDKAIYSPACHHDILTETKGVSLERVSTHQPGTDLTNWCSASADAGYMTPAAPNSQAAEEGQGFMLGINPQAITPNGDGINEILLISYMLDSEGYMGQVFIYDIEGRKRRTLLNGDLLGTEGVLEFDGRGDDNMILPTGFYILFFYAYHTVERHFVKKLSFVLAVE